MEDRDLARAGLDRDSARDDEVGQGEVGAAQVGAGDRRPARVLGPHGDVAAALLGVEAELAVAAVAQADGAAGLGRGDG